MALECPQCRQPQPTLRRGSKAWFWQKWRCENCNSLIAIDKRRQFLLALTGPILYGLFNMFLIRTALTSPLIFYLLLAGLFILPLLLMWQCQRLVVLHACGTFCKKCAYNLRGNVSGRCPECGEKCAANHNQDIPTDGIEPLDRHHR